jgi:hypothetical protein
MTKVFDKPKSKSFKFDPNSNLPKRSLVTSQDILPNDMTSHRFPTIPSMPIQPRLKALKRAHGNSSGKASAASKAQRSFMFLHTHTLNSVGLNDRHYSDYLPKGSS